MVRKFLDYVGLSRFIENLKVMLESYVPMARKVGGHDLSQNIDLDAHDVGALNEDDIYDLIEKSICHNIREIWGIS